MNEVKDHKTSVWSVVPGEVVYDRRLKDGAVRVYACISGVCGSKGCTFASNEWIARKIGKKKWTVSRLVRQLEECGHIVTVVMKEEANTRYILTINTRHLQILAKASIIKGSEKTADLLSKKAIALLSKKASPIAEISNPPIAENSNHRIREENKEREGLTLPDFLNDKKNKGVIYLNARDKYLFPTEGFVEWFEENVLKRLPKFNANTVNDTTLNDFDTQVFSKYGIEISTQAVLDMINDKPKLNGNVPGAGELKRYAGAIYRAGKLAQKTIESKKNTEAIPERKGMWDEWLSLAETDPKKFVYRYGTEQFFRAAVDRKEDLTTALEKAKKKIKEIA